MRSLIFSTMLAMVLTLTGVLTFGGAEQNEVSKPSEGIEQRKDLNVNAQEKSGDMNPQEYIVKKGDTVVEISETFLGTLEKWQEIAKANDLDNPDQPEFGDHLLIPNASVNINSEFNQRPNTDNQEEPPDAGSKINQMNDDPGL